jgi:hypothetical protein
MRFFSTSLCIIQTVFAFILLSSNAFAQSQQDKVTKARDAIEKAQQFLTTKRYDQAIKEFEIAHQLQPDLQNLIMIANLYGKLNLCMDSIQTWQNALDFCQNCEDRPSIMQKQQKILEKCYVSVSFSSNPIGIEVYQNQNKLGLTPFIKPFTLGEYTLAFKKEGFEDHQETIYVGENDLRQKGKLVHIDLIPSSQILNTQNFNQNTEPNDQTQTPSSKKKIIAYSLLAGSVAILAFDLFYYTSQKPVMDYLSSNSRGVEKLPGQKDWTDAQRATINARDADASFARNIHYTALSVGLLMMTSSVFTFVF